MLFFLLQYPATKIELYFTKINLYKTIGPTCADYREALVHA